MTRETRDNIFFFGILLALLFLAAALACAAPKPKQGVCHTCQCDTHAEKCIKECGSKKICVMACAHDCKMKAAGISKCPAPRRMRQAANNVGPSPYLTGVYQADNVMYFGARLPDVRVLVSDEVDNDPRTADIARTDILYGPTKKFQITVFTHWAPANKTQEEALKHEECHILLEENDIVELNQHGSLWQMCMLNLAEKGAFSELW